MVQSTVDTACNLARDYEPQNMSNILYRGARSEVVNTSILIWGSPNFAEITCLVQERSIDLYCITKNYSDTMGTSKPR